MSTGSVFSLQVAEFVAKAKGNATLVFRKVALEAFTRVVIKTPVDEGRARGSWQVAIGSIPVGAAADFNDKTGTVTISKIQAAALQLQVGDVIYLVSSLVYMPPLEYGHSKQAPNGMVRLTVSEWNSIVSGAAASLPK